MAITAVLGAESLSVDPGESVAGDLRLRNDGADDVQVRLAVTGAARPYSWLAPEAVTVPPGGETTARLGFTLPRASVPAAGSLPFVVTATVDGGAAPAATVAGSIEVRPFCSLSATLSEDGAADGAGGAARFEVTIGNRGNGAMPAALRGEADEPDLDVRVDPRAVTVAPDAKASASVAVATGRRPLTGRPRTSTFRVVVTPTVGEAVTVEGRVHRKPLFAGPVLAAAAVVVVLALVGGGLALASGGGSSRPAHGAVATATTDVASATGAATGGKLDACPAKDHGDAYGVRDLTPTEIAKLPNTYTFLHVQPDGCTPSRFNPCQPIHYIQNAAAAPPDVVANVREAFRRLSVATGMTFVDDGFTDETDRTTGYVPERYGSRWAPILISWEHFPADQTNGRSQILGNTLPFRVQEQVVSARLRFNVDAYNDEFTKAPIQAGFGPPAGSGTGPIGRENITWGRILLHELAHVVGLGHTSDFGSLMYPDAAQQTIRPADFSRNDLAGLRYLGKEAGCLTTPPLPAS
jgi:hypothetical protein